MGALSFLRGKIRSRRPSAANRLATQRKVFARAVHPVLESLENRLLLANVYVDASVATGSHNGSSWSNAYQDLQQALTAATSGTTILVAAGTYKPTSGADRSISFQFTNGVEIDGGYAGDANPATPNARDIALYPSILSGDIGTIGSNTDNSYHVVVGSGTNSTAILDGFTITAGSGAPGSPGGGIRCSSSNPTISNCTLLANSAGGMYNESSSPTLTNCTFSGNSGHGVSNSSSSPTLTNCTFSGNSSGSGGGMYNSASSPRLTNCTFTGNSATFLPGPMSGQQSAGGGGMFNSLGSSPTLTNCTFTGNSAKYTVGGGMYSDSSSPTLIDCVFSANSADRGGGMGNTASSWPTLTNCTFSGNLATSTTFACGGAMENRASSPTLTGCTFSGNSARYGGGIYNASSSFLTLTNCTFNGNSASSTTDANGGAIFSNLCSLTLTNCILSGNSASGTTVVFGAGMYNDNCSLTLANCILSGNVTGGTGMDVRGGGMINVGCSLTLANCTFSRNSATRGGGMYNVFSSPTISNCTFTGNTASYGGGISNTSSSPTLINCILWSNTAATGGNQIYDGGGTSTVSYTDVQGGFAGTGNINVDPLFVRNPGPGTDGTWGTADDDYGDLRLQLTSPAIDAGDNSAVPAGISTDLAGNPRFFDLPTRPDTGSGTAPMVDMGAYEALLLSVSFSAASHSTAESAGTANVLVQLSSASSSTVTVPFTLSGSAQRNSDYTLASTSITIPAGSTTGTISFQITNDALYEANETIIVSMGTPTNAVTGAITTHTLTILDNDPPVLDPITAKTVNEGTALSFTATLPSGGRPVTFSLDSGAPAAASIDPASGLFTWTPGEARGPDVYPITIRATDNGNPALSATRTFNITVNEVNEAPTLAAIAIQSTNEGTLLQFTATATDPDLPANTLSFTLGTGAPSGAAINATTGVFSWTPTEAQGAGVYPVTIRVTDNGSPALSDSQIVNITVGEINQAPVLAVIADKTTNEKATLSFTATATDPDLPANALTFSLEADAPAGASINPSTGLFTWTPGESRGGGMYPITVRVTDNGAPALSATRTFNVTVNDVNEAPVLAAIANQSVNEGSLLQFTATASDADLPANTLTYTLGPGAPAGASIDATSGVFTWTPTEGQGPGVYPVTIRVADDATPALSASRTFNITVNEVNQPPVLAAIANQTVNEGSLLQFTAMATDADRPANTLTFSLDSGAPAGASINATTGLFRFTPTDGPGSYPITVRVSDNRSPALSDAKTFTLTVNNIAPTAAFTGATVTLGSAATIRCSSVTDPSSADTAAGFIYRYDLDNNGIFEILGDSSGTYTVPAASLTSIGTYTVQGRIRDKDKGFSTYTTQINVLPPPPPAAPSALSAQAIAAGQVWLKWQDNASNESGFVLQQCANSSFSGFTRINLAADASSRIVSQPPGSTWYYRLRAVNATSKSSWSSIATATTPLTAPAVVVDNTAASLTGSWASSSRVAGYFGSDFLSDDNTGKGTKTARFTPTLSSTGSYAVYARWTAAPSRAGNVPIDVLDSTGTHTVQVDQRSNGSVWVLLGVYRFSAGTSGSVTIRTTGTTGVVIADAIKFVKV